MRQTKCWSAILVVATLLIGLAYVASPVQEVRAVATISQIAADIDGGATGDKLGRSVAMSADGTRIAIGAIGSFGNGNSAGYVRVYTLNNGTWTQTGTDIDGEDVGDNSGWSVAMSADGSRVAIGAIGNGNSAGHVRVYTLNGSTWTKTGSDIDGEDVGDNSGWSVAMSADGTRVAIGAVNNSGSGLFAGHVRVYTLNSNIWTKTGSDIDGETPRDNSGLSVAMSPDGTRIAIGAIGNRAEAGQVRVYTLNSNIWTKTGQDIDGEDAGDELGRSVAMSADGTRITIGAQSNDGNGTSAGHVRVYTLNSSTWTQTGADIDGEDFGDNSGLSVAMSADGTRITISAPYNDGNGTSAGLVRVYTLNSSTWTQTGADIDGEDVGDNSGWSVAMSADGTRIAIGAPNNSNQKGHVRLYAVPNAPSAPTISSVDAADGSLTVSFTVSTDGGSPITNYKYSVDGINYIALNPATITSPFTISGLTNETTYSVTIKAVNGAGDSPTSNALTGSPVAPAPVSASTTTLAPAVTTTTFSASTTIAAPTTTFAPAATTTTFVPITTASVQKVIQTNGELPLTGSNSSPLISFATILLSAGLLVVSRRRITS